MNFQLVYPVLTGFFLASAQFFMKKVADAIPTGWTLKTLIVSVIANKFTYIFVGINLIASVLYLLALRQTNLTNAFLTVFLSVTFFAFLFDCLANRHYPSAEKLVGVAFAILAVWLIVKRGG